MADWKAIHRLAATLEPRLRRAFLAAVKRLQGQVDVETLAAALPLGAPLTTAMFLRLDQFPAHLRDAVAVVNEAFTKGGALAGKQLAAQLGEAMAFDAVNPLAVRVAERVGARLVRQVSAETRKAIRGFVAQSISQGVTPRDTARLIRDVIGLTTQQARSVARYRFELLANGMRAAAVEEKVAGYAARKLRERAFTIARTEIIGALNLGQLEAWKQARRDGLLSEDLDRVWIITPDDRLCPRCLTLKDQVRPIGKAFEAADGTSVMAPPLHPRCRCAVGLQARSQSARRAA